MSTVRESTKMEQKTEHDRVTLLGKRQKLFEVEVVKNSKYDDPNKKDIDMSELKSEQPKVQKIARMQSDFEDELKNQIDDLFTAPNEEDQTDLATYEN